jgi:glutaredoxin
MNAEVILIYATDWCGDCRRARRFFDRRAIAYRWIDIDHDPEGERFVLTTNQGKRSVPTILLQSGEILVEPTDQQLANSFAQEKS